MKNGNGTVSHIQYKLGKVVDHTSDENRHPRNCRQHQLQHFQSTVGLHEVHCRLVAAEGILQC